MKFAYADPPYLHCGHLYADRHPDWQEYDDPAAHARLIARLVSEYPDGWAMSLSAPSLRIIFPMCPEDCRQAPWIKPFASFKPNVNPAYAHEYVIFYGGRKRGRDVPTIRDWYSGNITLRKGLTGAKPPGFVHWVLDWLNVLPGDQVDDLFPGTGIVGEVVAGRLDGAMPQAGLFEGVA